MEKSISFIIPAFNEEQSISNVLSELHNSLEKLQIDYEILVIDDGSSDKTSAIAEDFFSKKLGKGRLIKNGKNRGYGFSLKNGAKQSSKDLVFFYDADGQHKSDQISKLLDAYTNESKLIVGMRSNSKATPSWRKPGKALIRWVAETITRSSFPDLFSGFRLWDRTTFLNLQGVFPNGFSISTTSTVASQFTGVNIQWVEIDVEKRIGKSTATVMDGFRISLLLVRIITLFAPLRVFFPISVLVGLLGLYFTITSYVDTGVSSIRGLIALLISLTIALQGLLVDQVSALRRGEKIALKQND
jgi:glycosyltransferase involved in cell wall biosynthesis